MMIDESTKIKLKEKYNPEGSPLRKAQMRMLDLLLFLDKICKENQLTYWLDGGTLLGAARHEGFIPWDDDADVCMPRKDALKLKEIMGDKLFDGHIVLQNRTTDKKFPCISWMKLRDTKSECLQHDDDDEGQSKYRGVHLDIFMMEENLPYWVNKVSSLMYYHLVFYPVMRCNWFYTKMRPFIYLNMDFLEKVVFPPLSKIRVNNSVISHGIGIPFLHTHRHKSVYPLTTLDFEGVQLKAPIDANQYLIDIYGDWKKIPNESQIKTHNLQFRFYD